MPLYEYECDKCGDRFERIQRLSDDPVKTCPECGGAVEKLMSSPAIQFKGSGWYVTDYAKKTGAAAGSNGAGEAAPGGDKGEKKDKKDAKSASSSGLTKSASGDSAASSSSSSRTTSK